MPSNQTGFYGTYAEQQDYLWLNTMLWCLYDPDKHRNGENYHVMWARELIACAQVSVYVVRSQLSAD